MKQAASYLAFLAIPVAVLTVWPLRGIDWWFAINENTLTPALSRWERGQASRAQERATTGGCAHGWAWQSYIRELHVVPIIDDAH